MRIEPLRFLILKARGLAELFQPLLVTDILSVWIFVELIISSGREHPLWTEIWKRTSKVHFARLKGVFQPIGRDYARTALQRTRRSYGRIMFQFSTWAIIWGCYWLQFRHSGFIGGHIFCLLVLFCMSLARMQLCNLRLHEFCRIFWLVGVT